MLISLCSLVSNLNVHAKPDKNHVFLSSEDLEHGTSVSQKMTVIQGYEMTQQIECLVQI
jgi:hypothetical protein